MQRLTAILALALACSAAVADPGHIHGTVLMEDDKELSGVLNWDGEEIYWVHHFNGDHAEPYDISGLSDEEQEAIRDQQPGPIIHIEDTVIELAKWLGSDDMRPTEFAAEFGAIDKLVVGPGESVVVYLRDGQAVRLEGGSNDIDTDIFLKSQDGTDRELDWRSITEIRFSPAPADHPAFAAHAYGKVTTTSGVFEGLVEWDAGGGAPAERVATDKIDGDLADGREISVELGDIRSIANRGNRSLVTTRDGEEYLLEGSNDVDGRNSGIVVTNPDVGRMVIGWRAFERVDYLPIPEGFLPGRDLWESIGELGGEVTLEDGKKASGTVVFDVDEDHQSDVLEGKSDDIVYQIPFRLIESIEPADNGATVTLRTGRKLTLSGERDVSSSNNGVIIAGRYVPWAEVRSIRFP